MITRIRKKQNQNRLLEEEGAFTSFLSPLATQLKICSTESFMTSKTINYHMKLTSLPSLRIYQ